MANILLIESNRANGSSFAPHLERRYNLTVVNTGREALQRSSDLKPDVMILDAASMRTSGDRICASLRNRSNNLPIIHIKNQVPKTQANSQADITLYLPLTYRKLYNRIERYVVPVQDDDLLTCGTFQLNLRHQILTTPTQEKKLTPKLTTLMKLFMQNQNVILERRHLIKTVWQTDYMGDTRTLDVHIRWIRQVVEPSPSKPQYIKTVRGKGYIFNPKASVSN